MKFYLGRGEGLRDLLMDLDLDLDLDRGVLLRLYDLDFVLDLLSELYVLDLDLDLLCDLLLGLNDLLYYFYKGLYERLCLPFYSC